MTVILCPTCVGAGTIRKVKIIANPRTDAEDDVVIETVTCYTCNGTGKLNKYVFIDEEKDKGEK
jgi:DnaJ-class molecular chaperone